MIDLELECAKSYKLDDPSASIPVFLFICHHNDEKDTTEYYAIGPDATKTPSVFKELCQCLVRNIKYRLITPDFIGVVVEATAVAAQDGEILSSANVINVTTSSGRGDILGGTVEYKMSPKVIPVFEDGRIDLKEVKEEAPIFGKTIYSDQGGSPLFDIFWDALDREPDYFYTYGLTGFEGSGFSQTDLDSEWRENDE